MDPLLQRIEAGEQPSFDEIVAAWGETFPLLRELAQTPQDPEWHAEGDVHIHTSMVLAQIYEQINADETWHRDERTALILGAIFHDVAKPITTRTKDIDGRERVVAPRHADIGRSRIAYKLQSLGLPYGQIRRVMGLVGHHHDPKWLVLKNKQARHYHKLARMADTKLLYALECADLRGRICPDLDEQLDIIEMYRLEAEEHGVWGETPPYNHWQEQLDDALQDQSPELREVAFADAIRDAEAGLIYTPEEAIARSYKYRQGFGQLVLMCGPSGSGKSTWAEKHLEGYEVLSLDQIRKEVTGKETDQSANSRVRQIARDRLKPLLQHNHRVVWDATNLRKDFRSAVIQLGYDYGALVTLVAVQCSEKGCFSRNAQRQRNVPKNVLRHQLDNTQWPYENEAHRTAFIGDDGELLYTNSEQLRQQWGTKR